MPRICWIATLFLVAGCGGARATLENPRIEMSDIGATLYLPPAMQQALDAAAPGLRLVRMTEFRSDVAQSAAQEGHGLQPLFAVVRDFNRDGLIDVAVEGARPGSTSLEVFAILNAKTPVATPVTSFPEYDADAVGIYLAPPADTARDAFQVVNYPDATTVYTVHDGAFVPASP